MLKNEKQYKTAKSQLNKLKAALNASTNPTIKMSREIYETMIAGIISQIEEVELKIKEYDQNKHQNTETQKIADPNFPDN